MLWGVESVRREGRDEPGEAAITATLCLGSGLSRQLWLWLHLGQSRGSNP